MPNNREESQNESDGDAAFKTTSAQNTRKSRQAFSNGSNNQMANSNGSDALINEYERQYEIEEQSHSRDQVHSPSVHSKGGKSNAKSAISGLSSSTHSSDAEGKGKEISDVGARKILYMRYAILSFVLHILFLVLLVLFNQSAGLILPFNPDSFLFSAPPIMFGLALVCFFINELAMKDAFAAGAGYLLSRPEGFSIAICGFNHASTIKKMLFFRLLGKDGKPSKIKWILVGFSAVWGIHGILFPLAFVSSVGISAEYSRIDTSISLMCLTYSQRDSSNTLKTKDRQIPTLQHEMGVAELIDSTAMGTMRSSDPTLTNSTHFLPPQLTDVCQDGSTIIGNGFKTDILSKCSCSSDSSVNSFTAAGFSSNDATAIAANLSSTLKHPAMINYLSYSNLIITLNTVLAGTGNSICPLEQSYPICKTEISNHQVAKFLVTYKTDGTPASIAAHKINLVESIEDADMEHLFATLKIQLGTSASMQHLLPTFYNSVNPMLWMMTTNSRNISSDLQNIIDPGMEYATALILRSSIQRSYIVTGGFCQENIVNDSTVTIFISSWAFAVGIFWVVVQLLILISFALMYIPWVLTEVPIFPGIQIAQDPLVFAFIACKNVIPNGKLKSFQFHNTKAVWAKMDIVLRIGESVLSAEDPERGVIVLDKPKMVTEMSYEKTYV